MPVVYSQQDLRPLLKSDDDFVRLIDAVEAGLIERHNGAGGHAFFTGLPLEAETGFQIYGVAAPGNATVRIFPAERNRGSTADTAYVLVLNPESSALEAILAGDDLNPLRTSVPVGVGARHLAAEDAGVVCILGSGEQARSCARAIFSGRPGLKELVVWSPTPANRERFAEEHSAALGISARACETAEEAVRAADIVVAAGRLSSGEAAYEASWVKPGALAISMTRSAPPELMAQSRLVFPTNNRPETVAIGFVGAKRPVPMGDVEGIVELVDVIEGRVQARESAGQTVVLELANLYAWDHAVATWAYDWAKENATGTLFALTQETE